MTDQDSVGKTTILDVGHGSCAVIESQGSTVVVDTGAGAALIEYLEDAKIEHVDTVVLSHADADHIGGLVALVASEIVTVRAVALNSDAAKGSAAWDDMLFELNDASIRGEIDVHLGLKAGDEPISCGDARLSVLGPSVYLAGKGAGSTDRGGRAISSNSISAVLLLQHGDSMEALFTGDLDRVGFDDLLRDQPEVKARVLVFPHHGGLPKEGAPREFARELTAAVCPETVVVSNARRKKPNNPQPEIVDGIRDAAPTCRIACTQLSFHCAPELRKSEPRHLTEAFASGRTRGVCCAGSVLLDHGEGTVVPSQADHQEHIEACASNPLCRVVADSSSQAGST